MSNLVLIFLTMTSHFNLPPGLLSAICYVESRHNEKAIHIDDGSSSSVGLCQLHGSTARMLGFVGSDQLLLEPTTNAYYAASYLDYQLKRYDGDVVKAISAYNAGHFRAGNLDYVRKVLKAWEEHK